MTSVQSLGEVKLNITLVNVALGSSAEGSEQAFWGWKLLFLVFVLHSEFLLFKSDCCLMSLILRLFLCVLLLKLIPFTGDLNQISHWQMQRSCFTPQVSVMLFSQELWQEMCDCASVVHGFNSFSLRLNKGSGRAASAAGCWPKLSIVRWQGIKPQDCWARVSVGVLYKEMESGSFGTVKIPWLAQT